MHPAARRIISTMLRIWNERDLTALEGALFEGNRAEGAVGTEDTITSYEEYEAYHATLLEAFPDFWIEILDCLASDESVVLRARLTGTHLGSFMGLAATGRAMATEAWWWFRHEEGVAYRCLQSWDLAGLLAQLGAISLDLPGILERSGGALPELDGPDGREEDRVDSGAEKILGNLERIWNERDLSASVGSHFEGNRAEGAVTSKDAITTFEEFKAFHASLLEAFPDFHLERLDTLATEGKLAARYRLTGTHLGTFMGVPATGREVAIDCWFWFLHEDGVTIRCLQSWDLAGLLHQLGALELGPATDLRKGSREGAG